MKLTSIVTFFKNLGADIEKAVKAAEPVIGTAGESLFSEILAEVLSVIKTFEGKIGAMTVEQLSAIVQSVVTTFLVKTVKTAV